MVEEKTKTKAYAILMFLGAIYLIFPQMLTGLLMVQIGPVKLQHIIAGAYVLFGFMLWKK